MWYKYRVEYFSALRKNKNMSFLGKWMDWRNKLESERHIVCFLSDEEYIL
jgi:hypothetical protein